ncbi:MAG TPA: PaaI family thioesterase [Armatimonadota bacterium]|nr:PaaI family thioesterase [Armatimonadota bacterium]
MKLRVDDMCFACGKKNPIGLKLEFRFDGDDYVTEFEVKPEYQGWAGIVHGGLLATALDETMARLLWEKDLNAITGRLNVRYHDRLTIGEKVTVRARITKHRSPLIETTAEALKTDGTVVAEATAVSMEV